MPDQNRNDVGAAVFKDVIGSAPHTPSSPLGEAAMNFVFAEVWNRPGLDRRARRFITLACACAARAPAAIRTYMTAALDSGDITEGELREFILQFAVFQGFPKAVEVEFALNELLTTRE